MTYYDVNLDEPERCWPAYFIGSMMAFVFCGLTMNAVGRAAQKMVNEVRRQFREIKGYYGQEKPSPITPDAWRSLPRKGHSVKWSFPSLLAIIIPVVVGLIFGVAGVMGLLAGGLGSGFVLAVFMANSGGAWDNAKKYVEEGHLGGKGSECHKATVIGDTVGDPIQRYFRAEPEYIDKTYEHGSYRDGWCDLYVQLAVKVEYGVSRTCGPM